MKSSNYSRSKSGSKTRKTKLAPKKVEKDPKEIENEAILYFFQTIKSQDKGDLKERLN